MWIKMLTRAAGPGGVLQPGQEYEVPDEVAIEWLEAGFATPMRKKREISVIPRPERAVAHVLDVEGMEERFVEALKTLGVHTAADLAESDVIELTSIGGVGKATAARWQAAARKLVEE